MHQQVKDALVFITRPTVKVRENEKRVNGHVEKTEPPVTPNLTNGQKIGLFLGPLLFFAILFFFPAEDLSRQGVGVLAATVWITTWWISEAVPIPITSLLPILLFPILGVTGASEVTIPYAYSIIFLFIGGFMLVLAGVPTNVPKPPNEAAYMTPNKVALTK